MDTNSPFSSLGPRVLVAVAGIPLVLLATHAGGGWLLALVLALSLLGQWELYAMGDKIRWPLKATGMLAGALVLFHVQYGLSSLWPLLLALFLAGAAALVVNGEIEGALGKLALTGFGVLYVPALLSHMLAIRKLEHGFILLLWPIVLVWICDTGAYFAGVTLGRHKLAPAISPKKSVEGLIGGIIATMAASWLFQATMLKSIGQITVLHSLLFGLGVSLFATIGDLAESLFKRSAGVKDSGRLLPGHGGVLDRFDSMLFALPFAYWYLRLAVMK